MEGERCEKCGGFSEYKTRENNIDCSNCGHTKRKESNNIRFLRPNQQKIHGNTLKMRRRLFSSN